MQTISLYTVKKRFGSAWRLIYHEVVYVVGYSRQLSSASHWSDNYKRSFLPMIMHKPMKRPCKCWKKSDEIIHKNLICGAIVEGRKKNQVSFLNTKKHAVVIMRKRFYPNLPVIYKRMPIRVITGWRVIPK